MKRALAGGLMALAIVAGCGKKSLIEITPTWPLDQIAVLVITGSNDSTLGPSPAILESDPAKFTLDVEDTIRVHVATFPQLGAGGPDFTRCGVAIHGDGSMLGLPAHYFVSEPVDTREQASITLTEASRDTANALGLTFAIKACTFTYPCEQIHVRAIDAPIQGMHAIVASAIDDHRAFVGAAAHDTDPAVLLDVGDARASLLLSDPVLGPMLSLVFDGTKMWGSTTPGYLFTLALDGTVTSSVVRLGGLHALKVSSDRNGTVIAYGDDGVHVLAGVSDAEKRRAIESLADETSLLSLYSQDRMVAIAGSSLYYFDGRNWMMEREIGPKAFEEFYVIDVDADSASVGGKDGQVIVRDETTHMWQTAPVIDPSNVVSVKGLASLGGGRLLEVGEAGTAAVYQAGTWCTFETGTTNIIQTLALAPGRRIAYAAGHYSMASDNRPVLFRIELPE